MEPGYPFPARGFEEVFVQADKIDTNAVDFYRSTKPTEEEQVLHFYYRL
jgi:aminoglycoside 3-N-acetyltransferase I